jgi:hypothetical protein
MITIIGEIIISTILDHNSNVVNTPLNNPISMAILITILKTKQKSSYAFYWKKPQVAQRKEIKTSVCKEISFILQVNLQGRVRPL